LKFAQESVVFQHLLIPVDGSQRSEDAARQGLQLAKTFGARATAFHVTPRFHAAGAAMELLGSTADACPLDAAERAGAVLRFAARVATALGVDCELDYVCADTPYEAIIDAADRKGCDLIVMASHGRRGLEGILLGSQTHKVLTHSRIPVLVYR
jgi:nucleotide-binding universal stress UspA family protein